jgi:hypothetical protein
VGQIMCCWVQSCKETAVHVLCSFTRPHTAEA